MDRILQLFPKQHRGTLRKARGKTDRLEEAGQLALFAPRPAVVHRLGAIAAFDEALLLDDRGSESAEAAYLRALEEGDRPADAACNLGVIASQSSDSDRALGWFIRALTEDPAHFEAHYNLGHLYLDLDLHRPARVHFEVAASLQPTCADLYYNLALALVSLCAYGAAAHALRHYRVLSGGEEDDGADRLLDELELLLEVAR